MLVPPAVVTGPEFRSVEHAAFAVAQTDLGCVEIRFMRGHYVNPQQPTRRCR